MASQFLNMGRRLMMVCQNFPKYTLMFFAETGFIISRDLFKASALLSFNIVPLNLNLICDFMWLKTSSTGASWGL